jgi:hypothetical protein
MPRMTLQPSISGDARSQALLGLAERLGRIDLSRLLVYRIASAPAAALPFLAWQFDVLSPLWQLVGAGDIDALTDIDDLTDIDTIGSSGSGEFAEARALIQNAIALHRIRGTAGAVKQAIAALGWTAALLEGQASWGGNSYPASQGWAVCRVLIQMSAGETIGADDFTAIAAAFNFYKPARVWLDSVIAQWPGLSDTLAPAPHDVVGMFDRLTPSDAISVIFTPISDTLARTPAHDRGYQHAGVTYANQPVGPSDGATTLNGNPIEGNP